MTTNRVSGLLLITGAAGVIITLGLHPSGRDLFVPGQTDSAVRHLVAVHSIALASLPLWFLGACGLAKRLAPGRDFESQGGGPLAFAGLAIYGFALVAMMNAVVIDGLVSGDLARQIVNSTGTVGQGWRIALNHNSFLDGAFMHVFLVASSIAIVLWSLLMVRRDGLARGLGVYGCVLGVASLAGVVSGQLNRHLHVFMLTLLGQAIWSITSGVWLLNSEAD